MFAAEVIVGIKAQVIVTLLEDGRLTIGGKVEDPLQGAQLLNGALQTVLGQMRKDQAEEKPKVLLATELPRFNGNGR